MAPIGYTVFAVALGIFAGTVWRKVVPAMAFTLVGFAILRVLLDCAGQAALPPAPKFAEAGLLVREPDTGCRDARWLGAPARHPGTRRGTWAPNAQVSCPRGATVPGGGVCGGNLDFGSGAYNWRLYQPADRYWLFQGIETGIFVALAALLLFLAVRQIRRIA